MSAAFSSANIDVTAASTAATALSLTLARKRYAFDERERIKKRRKQPNPIRLSLEYAADSTYDGETSDTECEKHISNYAYRAPPPPKTFQINEPAAAAVRLEPPEANDSTAVARHAVDEPSAGFKLEPGERVKNAFDRLAAARSPPPPTLAAGALVADTLAANDALPLNLTKNASRIEDCIPHKVEPTKAAEAAPARLYSPRSKEELPKASGSVASGELTGYEHFVGTATTVANSVTAVSLSPAADDRKDRSPPPFSPRATALATTSITATTSTTSAASVMRAAMFTNAVSRTTCRIFNPEAFCNICNKEFCNKYFLKTHKANKHGVYCENKDLAAAATTSTTATTTTTTVGDTDLPVSATAAAAAAAAIPLMFTWNVKNNNVKLPPNPYLFGANAAVAAVAAAAAAAAAATTVSVKDSSAFCSICEKEFCNKYFLRRHKEKMHGIVPPLSGDGGRAKSETESEGKCEADDAELRAPSIGVVANNAVANMMIGGGSGDDAKSASFLAATAATTLATEYRRNELTHNSSTKCDKSKYAKTYAAAAGVDAVSDFIKICLTGGAGGGGGKSVLRNEFDQSTAAAVAADAEVVDYGGFVQRGSGGGGVDDTGGGGCVVDLAANISKMIAERGNVVLRRGRRYDNGKGDDIEATDYSLHAAAAATDENCHDAKRGGRAKSLPAAKYAYDERPESDRVSPQRYGCDLCKKFFSTDAILRLHQKYVHAVAGTGGGGVGGDDDDDNANNDDDDDDDENADDEVDNVAEFKHVESVYFMILKFSWLNTAVTFCEACQTEFEKSDTLEAHLMNAHGSLVDELSRIVEDASLNGVSPPALTTGDGRVICQICNKTFGTNAAFQQHVYEKCIHPDYKEYGDSATTAATAGTAAAAAAVVAAAAIDDSTDSSKSTRNFCEICKKELCNKYFMKTHMRRMHGIALQNGVRIGGVTCEICNKELCSKYFLRVHKKNCHGIMENAQFARMLLPDGCGGSVGGGERSEETTTTQPPPQPAAATPASTPSSKQQHASQMCGVCGRIFKSVKWLKSHLLGDHGKLGAIVWRDMSGYGTTLTASNECAEGAAAVMATFLGETTSTKDDDKYASSPAYQCSRCQFQASSVDVLLAHQKLHAKSSSLEQLQYRCLYCFVVTKDKVALEEHIAYHHFGNADFADKTEFSTSYHFAGKANNF